MTCTARVLALATRRPDPEALFHLTLDIRAATATAAGKQEGQHRGGGGTLGFREPAAADREKGVGREGGKG